MPTRRTAVLSALALLVPGGAAAHHGWGSFDRTQTREISGSVLRSSYVNPHGIVVLREQGRELTFELAPVSRMRARGLSEADIAPGKAVRLFAYRNAQNAALYRAEWIEVDGRRIELRA